MNVSVEYTSNILTVYNTLIIQNLTKFLEKLFYLFIVVVVVIIVGCAFYNKNNFFKHVVKEQTLWWSFSEQSGDALLSWRWSTTWAFLSASICLLFNNFFFYLSTIPNKMCGDFCPYFSFQLSRLWPSLPFPNILYKNLNHFRYDRAG